MNALVHLFAHFQPESAQWSAYSSLQNRSLKYFSPESGNTVTITARSPRGTRRATAIDAQSAPPALTPTKAPSSRPSPFRPPLVVSRCPFQVSARQPRIVNRRHNRRRHVLQPLQPVKARIRLKA